MTKPTILVRRAWRMLFYPAFVAVVAAPAVRVLGLKGAFELSALALAWFVFTRLLLIFCVGSVLSSIRSIRTASSRVRFAMFGVVIDSCGVIAARWFDHRLIWSAVAAIVFTEPVFWWHEATRSPEVSTA